MRMSELLLPTLFEEPREAESISHRLMLRAGLIRMLAAGIYSFLPLGNRVLLKVIRIIREEMDRIGAQELLMPALHPKELWMETGRWELYGQDMFKFKDRKDREFGLGPTHEEVITDIVRKIVRSYRGLPKILYQIQTKFRDEPRPRFGIMRGREFIMKDAYSFGRSDEEAGASYENVYTAYCRIFERLGLDYRAVEADPGLIGGSSSHEFMVMAESGEDLTVICDSCGYAANLEQAEVGERRGENKEELRVLELKETPGMKTVEEVSNFLGVSSERLIKTLLYKADGRVIAVLVPGDREVNETKLRRLLGCSCLEMADVKTIEEVSGCEVGFSGPIGLEGVLIIADESIKEGNNFVVGANRTDAHYLNANLDRDFKVGIFGDVKIAEEKDPCSRCQGSLKICRGIELGHVFKLGTQYSEAMHALFMDEEGRERPIIMGCYGIGVTRLIAAIIEQSHDEKGIIWPMSVAPYKILILPVNITDNFQKDLSEELYKELLDQDIEVLIDDRDESAGRKFNDADLIGIPLRLFIGKKAKETGKIEISYRTGEKFFEEREEISEKIKGLIDISAKTPTDYL
ncbi:TPA: proline--tRNA ligase [bacterium]|nr:proline--tRNA ligase [bacterium]